MLNLLDIGVVDACNWLVQCNIGEERKGGEEKMKRVEQSKA